MGSSTIASASLLNWFPQNLLVFRTKHPKKISGSFGVNRSVSPYFIYSLVLSFHRSSDIISDHSLMGMMVQIGSPVCVRINSDNSMFYMGRIIDKKSQPAAYHVNLDTVPENTQEPAVWVSKANIRLLQPPW